MTSQFGFNTLVDIHKTLNTSPLDRDHIVVEAGLGGAGGMKPMAEALQPHVAVVTMVAMEHKSDYRNVETIALEKGYLVEALPSNGLAMLNGDDPLVAEMAKRTRARVVTFGQEPRNTYRATDARAAFPDRLSFTVQWDGGTLALQTPFAGAHFWLPTLAATSTALELGVPPSLIARQVANFEPPLDRCGVIEIPGGPAFILDTRKAPQHSLGLAFDLVANASAPRRRIVLGQISDGRGSSEGQYRKAYRMAREAADQVIFVGDNAHRSNASEQDRSEGRFMEFRTTKQAADYIRATAMTDEVILLKGSNNLHLERIALDWKSDVRCWEPACGIISPCMSCGLHGAPFEEHRGRKRRKGLRERVSKLIGVAAATDA